MSLTVVLSLFGTRHQRAQESKVGPWNLALCKDMQARALESENT